MVLQDRCALSLLPCPMHTTTITNVDDERGKKPLHGSPLAVLIAVRRMLSYCRCGCGHGILQVHSSFAVQSCRDVDLGLFLRPLPSNFIHAKKLKKRSGVTLPLLKWQWSNGGIMLPGTYWNKYLHRPSALALKDG